MSGATEATDGAGIFDLAYEILAGALALPPGVVIVGVRDEGWNGKVEIAVRGPGLPTCKPGAIMTRVRAIATQKGCAVVTRFEPIEDEVATLRAEVARLRDALTAAGSSGSATSSASEAGAAMEEPIVDLSLKDGPSAERVPPHLAAKIGDRVGIVYDGQDVELFVAGINHEKGQRARLIVALPDGRCGNIHDGSINYIVPAARQSGGFQSCEGHDAPGPENTLGSVARHAAMIREAMPADQPITLSVARHIAHAIDASDRAAEKAAAFDDAADQAGHTADLGDVVDVCLAAGHIVQAEIITVYGLHSMFDLVQVGSASRMRISRLPRDKIIRIVRKAGKVAS